MGEKIIKLKYMKKIKDNFINLINNLCNKF